METKLTPVSHPTLPDHHRVPVIMQDGRYQIYLIENYVRIYDEDELPDLVKTRIAMIKAGTATSPIPQHMMKGVDMLKSMSVRGKA
jgi:hypothetical protein